MNVKTTDIEFTVRACETGMSGRATLAALCNWMQEAAGISADSLGWGIREIQEKGVTWMLSRLKVAVASYPALGEKTTVKTWPSGMKGRLVAKRCFLGLDADGKEIFRASSEWLYVDVAKQKIEKLPDGFAELVPPGTPDVELPDLGGKFAHLPREASASAEILARHSDQDLNDHVNNVPYLEWMVEAAPEKSRPAALDIVFRSAAKAGDRLVSQTCAGEEPGVSLHAIVRESDGAVLATAAIREPGVEK